MKLVLTLEANSVSVQAPNMGRAAVDVDGVNLSELISKVSENSYLLRMVDKSDQHATSMPPPLTTLTCIRCSTVHATETDNVWLHSLSYRTNDDGESEQTYFIGSGYLLCTDVWPYPVLRLKRLGLPKTFHRLVATLTRRYDVSFIHLDASAERLPGLPTFN